MRIRNPNPEIKNSVIIGSDRSQQFTVVKQSENIPMDANKLAEYEQAKLNQETFEKKSKIESFINSTRINASKIQREKLQISMESINSKKTILEKQKSIKAKYTVLKKPQQQIKRIKAEPMKVDWKKAGDLNCKMKIIEYKQQQVPSSDQEEAIDSQFQGQKITTPEQLLSKRENIRKAMLMRSK